MYAVVARSTIEDFDFARKFLRDKGDSSALADAGLRRWSLGEAWGEGWRIDDPLRVRESRAGAGQERIETSSPPVVKPISIEVGEVPEHT